MSCGFGLEVSIDISQYLTLILGSGSLFQLPTSAEPGGSK